MPINFHIVSNHPHPIYQQIVDQVRHGIATGKCVPGEALPSVRILAHLLMINPNTVARAYGELVREDLVASSPGRPLVIAAKLPNYTESERRRRLQTPLRVLACEAIALDVPLKEVLDALRETYQQLQARPKQETPP